MQERNFQDQIIAEKELSPSLEEKMKQIKEAVERLMDGKIKSITIYRKGPIQER